MTPGGFSPGPSTPPNFDPIHYLLAHGFTWVASYRLTTLRWRGAVPAVRH